MDNLKIDDNLLAELGFAHLTEEQKQQLEAHMLETLQMRVGLRLSEDLSDDQLKELEAQFVPEISDTEEQVAQKQQAVTAWLEQNHPNYSQVVADEFAKLKEDMKKHASDSLDSVLSS